VTNGGVASTVRDAHMRDYRTLVLSDGCATFTDTAHQAAMTDMASVAEVVTCAQFLNTL
jgi:ureidoacrylate peracid hydrolase